MPKKPWQPKYNYSEAIVKALMKIEGAKAVMDHVTLPPAIENDLRHRTRVRSSHFSTFIEGNRLTLSEVAEVLEGQVTAPQNRERDVLEVRNYWNALLKVEKWAASQTALTEKSIRQLHAILEKGKRAKPTPYRDGQNTVRDSITRSIVYMPPEAKDVPILMGEMIAWLNKAEKENIPIPIIASLIHYQLVTIHPFWDGNGRTARLLATFILHRGGYGINGFFSLEEHHARDLTGYYDSLMVHPNHNYYMGRADASLNKWLEYFLNTLAYVFNEAKNEALHLLKKEQEEPAWLNKLDRRARVVAGLFSSAEYITSSDVAATLGLSPRMARELLKEWVDDGWLIVSNSSKKGRQY
ncbi:MAG: Fic family protein, partial [Lentimicrobiaceae bacterium]|nr:Fic family protein [Lentimicrobiaceae bacterium]